MKKIFFCLMGLAALHFNVTALDIYKDKRENWLRIINEI